MSREFFQIYDFLTEDIDQKLRDEIIETISSHPRYRYIEERLPNGYEFYYRNHSLSFSINSNVYGILLKEREPMLIWLGLNEEYKIKTIKFDGFIGTDDDWNSMKKIILNQAQEILDLINEVYGIFLKKHFQQIKEVENE